MLDTETTPTPPTAPPELKSKKATTAQFKVIPETRSLRDQIRDAAAAYIKPLDKSRPLTKDEFRSHSDILLRQLGLGDQYLGFTLVCLANEFWREQVAAIPFHRRLLLVPHCLKNAEGCPADYDEFGLDCLKCGACSVADFKGKAEALGYKVLVAEGSPIVLKIIVSGYVDAIVGVACLNVLEKAIDKILLSGIPCFAVPLLSSDCRDTSVDEDWVQEMVQLRQEPAAATTRSYVHLMRSASGMFQPAELARLAQRSRLPQGAAIERVDSIDRLDPIGGTEAIAYDFLARG